MKSPTSTSTERDTTIQPLVNSSAKTRSGLKQEMPIRGGMWRMRQQPQQIPRVYQMTKVSAIREEAMVLGIFESDKMHAWRSRGGIVTAKLIYAVPGGNNLLFELPSGQRVETALTNLLGNSRLLAQELAKRKQVPPDAPLFSELIVGLPAIGPQYRLQDQKL